ncbi:oligopeptide/dipeptide ABC transporter ATP-binding protein [Halalkalicoccus subterraneus]|uniref:oligopeptide/dipeptide ABC transporter ATP-binding protein n=1 Tax=Halalkalicoccus subterraneus TaxID=2675002 RepID=UPI000EFC51EB|nr:oligopeptide/dipeptide ABC transporter ATP-binding protein [Halalkalicoccus subterraneus]
MTDPAKSEPPLLEVENLETHYQITKGLLRREVGRVRAVDGVSFAIARGEAFGLVGESGSGKTTTALSVLGLEKPTSGEIRFDGNSITGLPMSDLQSFRRRAQLIVQDPNEAFSPRMSVGQAVAEPLALHGMGDGDRRRAIIEDLLERVGLSASDADLYPHEFSDGEKQRLSIARALVLNPDLIVADEPTSALDGRVRSDILALLDSVRNEFDISMLFISHDLDTIGRFCDRIGVMYLGKIVEKGNIDNVLESPAHPYTRLLLNSVPNLDPTDQDFPRPLTDTVPDPSNPPSGCRYHTRCSEIIPPDDIDLPHEQWRSIAAFKFALKTGELPEEIDVGKSSRGEIRAVFELPKTIPDDRMDRRVKAAIISLAHGERCDAYEQLNNITVNVCERAVPEDIEKDGRYIACHHYDPTVEGAAGRVLSQCDMTR